MHPFKQKDWFGIRKSELTITENLILDVRKDVFNDEEYVNLLERKGVHMSEEVHESMNKPVGFMTQCLKIEEYLERMVKKWEEW